LLLQAGDSKFSAHRIVLAASIPYFNAMFTNDMVESKQDEIAVQGIEPRYVILRYVVFVLERTASFCNLFHNFDNFWHFIMNNYIHYSFLRRLSCHSGRMFYPA